MKKLLIIASVLAVTLSSAVGQGTIEFVNRITGQGTFDNAVTDEVSGGRLDGSGFSAQLYAGPAGSADGALTAVGAATAFRSGNAAGLWNAITVTIDSVAPGASARVQARAWDNNGGAVTSWEATGLDFARGESASFDSQALGGAGAPPSLPASFEGVGPFSIVIIPEPTTLVLGALGAAALVFFRRRK
jgi:hypothetical protein